jgi:hypothetical protein
MIGNVCSGSGLLFSWLSVPCSLGLFNVLKVNGRYTRLIILVFNDFCLEEFPTAQPTLECFHGIFNSRLRA